MMILAYLYLLTYFLFLFLFVFKKNKDNNNGCEENASNDSERPEGKNNKEEGGERQKKNEPLTVVDENASKKEDGGEGSEKKKDEKGPLTVIMKVDMNCDGCASEIARCVRKFEGVETVKTEVASNKVTVVGALDPIEIRDKLQKTTGKQVDLFSHQVDNDEQNDPKPHNPTDAENREEPLMTATVLKMTLHCYCDGCTNRIEKAVPRFKGVTGVSIDKSNELVTIKGSMDDKALTKHLKQVLKRSVEIVTSKKDQEEGKEPNNSIVGGSEGGNSDGGDKHEVIVGHGNDDCGGDNDGGSSEDVGATPSIEMKDQLPGFPYQYGYHAIVIKIIRKPVKQFYEPQMSEKPNAFYEPQMSEKPNACSILQSAQLV